MFRTRCFRSRSNFDRVGVYLPDKDGDKTVVVGEMCWQSQSKLHALVLGLRFNQGRVVTTFAIASIMTARTLLSFCHLMLLRIGLLTVERVGPEP